ncbi:MAG: FlgO family outer membrane protein [Candidatus Sericytochromatia bacterium]
MQEFRMRGIAIALAGVLALGPALPGWSQQSTQAGPVRLAQVMQSKTIAVADFENLTGEARLDNLKRGISESLMTKLASRTELTLVERSQLDKAIQELGFSQSVYANAGQAKEIGKMLNADYIIAGNLVKAGSRFELNVRMIEVESAKISVSESYSFDNENDILGVVDYLSLLIPRKLNLYVSDRELELVRSRLNVKEQPAAAQADNGWVWWAIGGAVVVGAAVTIGVLMLRKKAD